MAGASWVTAEVLVGWLWPPVDVTAAGGGPFEFEMTQSTEEVRRERA